MIIIIYFYCKYLFFRWMDAVLHFLLVWYYCTLTIRENILRINGSRFVFINCWTLSMIWEFSLIFTCCNIYYHDTNILSLDFIMKLKWLHCRHLTKSLNILSLIHFAWNRLHITFQILGFAFNAILLWQQEYIYNVYSPIILNMIMFY